MSNEKQFIDFRKEVERLKEIDGAEEYAKQLAHLFLGNGLSLQTILLMAIDFGQQHPHWIPVEEELPKFDEQVLVYGLCPNGCRLFYVDCLIQDINNNGYPKWDDDTIIPTHWMKIVPPRKEE